MASFEPARMMGLNPAAGPRPAETAVSSWAGNQPIGKSWYAVYTCANHEKRVAEQLAGRSVEHFLPLYSSVRRWKDRRVQLQLPLFPGYVFVHIALPDRLQVLEIPSVARLVGFGGHPTALPDAEIERLREGLQGQWQAKPHPYLAVGRMVRVKFGPLEGLEGLLLRRKGSSRFVLSIHLIQRSIQIDVDALSVEPILSGKAARGGEHVELRPFGRKGE